MRNQKSLEVLRPVIRNCAICVSRISTEIAARRLEMLSEDKMIHLLQTKELSHRYPWILAVSKSSSYLYSRSWTTHETTGSQIWSLSVNQSEKRRRGIMELAHTKCPKCFGASCGCWRANGTQVLRCLLACLGNHRHHPMTRIVQWAPLCLTGFLLWSYLDHSTLHLVRIHNYHQRDLHFDWGIGRKDDKK